MSYSVDSLTEKLKARFVAQLPETDEVVPKDPIKNDDRDVDGHHRTAIYAMDGQRAAAAFLVKCFECSAREAFKQGWRADDFTKALDEYQEDDANPPAPEAGIKFSRSHAPATAAQKDEESDGEDEDNEIDDAGTFWELWENLIVDTVKLNKDPKAKREAPKDDDDDDDGDSCHNASFLKAENRTLRHVLNFLSHAPSLKMNLDGEPWCKKPELYQGYGSLIGDIVLSLDNTCPDEVFCVPVPKTPEAPPAVLKPRTTGPGRLPRSTGTPPPAKIHNGKGNPLLTSKDMLLAEEVSFCQSGCYARKGWTTRSYDVTWQEGGNIFTGLLLLRAYGACLRLLKTFGAVACVPLGPFEIISWHRGHWWRECGFSNANLLHLLCCSPPARRLPNLPPLGARGKGKMPPEPLGADDDGLGKGQTSSLPTVVKLFDLINESFLLAELLTDSACQKFSEEISAKGNPYGSRIRNLTPVSALLAKCQEFGRFGSIFESYNDGQERDFPENIVLKLFARYGEPFTPQTFAPTERNWDKHSGSYEATGRMKMKTDRPETEQDATRKRRHGGAEHFEPRDLLSLCVDTICKVPLGDVGLEEHEDTDEYFNCYPEDGTFQLPLIANLIAAGTLPLQLTRKTADCFKRLPIVLELAMMPLFCTPADSSIDLATLDWNRILACAQHVARTAPELSPGETFETQAVEVIKKEIPNTWAVERCLYRLTCSILTGKDKAEVLVPKCVLLRCVASPLPTDWEIKWKVEGVTKLTEEEKKKKQTFDEEEEEDEEDEDPVPTVDLTFHNVSTDTATKDHPVRSALLRLWKTKNLKDHPKLKRLAEADQRVIESEENDRHLNYYGGNYVKEALPPQTEKTQFLNRNFIPKKACPFCPMPGLREFNYSLDRAVWRREDHDVLKSYGGNFGGVQNYSTGEMVKIQSCLLYVIKLKENLTLGFRMCSATSSSSLLLPPGSSVKKNGSNPLNFDVLGVIASYMMPSPHLMGYLWGLIVSNLGGIRVKIVEQYGATGTPKNWVDPMPEDLLFPGSTSKPVAPPTKSQAKVPAMKKKASTTDAVPQKSVTSASAKKASAPKKKAK